MAMAPPGMEAKKVERGSTPETRLRMAAASAAMTNVARVASTMAGQLAASAVITGGVK